LSDPDSDVGIEIESSVDNDGSLVLEVTNPTMIVDSSILKGLTDSAILQNSSKDEELFTTEMLNDDHDRSDRSVSGEHSGSTDPTIVIDLSMLNIKQQTPLYVDKAMVSSGSGESQEKELGDSTDPTVVVDLAKLKYSPVVVDRSDAGAGGTDPTRVVDLSLLKNSSDSELLEVKAEKYLGQGDIDEDMIIDLDDEFLNESVDIHIDQEKSGSNATCDAVVNDVAAIAEHGKTNVTYGPIEIDISTLEKDIGSDKVYSPTNSSVIKQNFLDKNITHDSDGILRLKSIIGQLNDERAELLQELDTYKDKVRDLERASLGYKSELEETRIELDIVKSRTNEEIESLKREIAVSGDKRVMMERKDKLYQEEIESLKGKVRFDLHKIKNRERELETQLEILINDHESQLKLRDSKILELKRKIDSLEFNMENLMISEEKAQHDKKKTEKRLEQAMGAIKGSIQVIEDDMVTNEDE